MPPARKKARLVRTPRTARTGKAGKAGKKSRAKRQIEPEVIDTEIYSSAEVETAAAQFDSEQEEYVQTVTFTSAQPFRIQPFVLPSGVFKGTKALMLLPVQEAEDRLSFLDLPPEVRLMVYRELFDESRPVLSFESYKARVWAQMEAKHSFPRRHNLREHVFHRTAIFTANRQIYEEAAYAFYSSKQLVFTRPKVLSDFLDRLGDGVKWLQHVSIIHHTHTHMGGVLSGLKGASSLHTLKLTADNWLGFPPGDHDASVGCSRYTRWRHYGIHDMDGMFFPLLNKLYEYTKDAEATSKIIKFDLEGVSCHCKTAEVLKAEYQKWAEERSKKWQKRIEDAAEAAEKRATLAAQKARVKAGIEDEDDYSYLEPESVSDRRVTGRPKRKSVTNVKYAE